MNKIKLSHYTATTCLGAGLQPMLAALQQQQSGLQRCNFPDTDLNTFIGRVTDLETIQLPQHLQQFSCRNNHLAYLALQQDQFLTKVTAAKQRYGTQRIAILIGTTASGIGQAEQAYQQASHHHTTLAKTFDYTHTAHPHATCEFLSEYLQLTGPSMMIGTACSSSSKAFAVAERMLNANICDAAIVGGIDSLCLNTLYGFNSLELLSNQPCRPCDVNRDGLNIGEAAGFVLLERIEGPPITHSLALLGYGESCDAYHMSTPHPDGIGAYLAMQHALQTAQLKPSDVNYINMHGTASLVNDQVEALAISKLFGNQTLCSSTKGWTGHTLGAAGIIETIISCLCLQHNFLPGCLNCQTIDPKIMNAILLNNKSCKITTILNNSFGFGGNNCSLLLGKIA
ncbi:MAG: beta-ketoacyl-[acyl-carrier-protein] synthase family protein [Gammaproteobacteria bacterium]|nr:beta-ketoacyl-[acyl-carrier-protein] synthase family protein [Gammaproteobacteria bacterium]